MVFLMEHLTDLEITREIEKRKPLQFRFFRNRDFGTALMVQNFGGAKYLLALRNRVVQREPREGE